MAYKKAVYQLLFFYILFILFFLSLSFYKFFSIFTGFFFARTDLGDYLFHLNRIQLPFCFIDGSCEYYAPLFHLLVSPLTLILNIESALTLFISLLFFILLPYSFYRLSKIYWNNEKIAISSAMIYLFGSITTLVFMTDAIYPQALVLFFFIMGIGSMIKDLKQPTHEMAWMPFLWGILAILSHSKGAIFYAMALIIWLFLRRSRIMAISITALGIISIFLLNYPLPTFYITSQKNLLEILFLWINPIVLALAYKGWKDTKTDNPSKLLDALITIILLASIIDPAHRPILFVAPILSVFSGKGLYEIKYRRGIFLILLLLWIAVLIFCTLGIYGLYIL